MTSYESILSVNISSVTNSTVIVVFQASEQGVHWLLFADIFFWWATHCNDSEKLQIQKLLLDSVSRWWKDHAFGFSFKPDPHY